MKINHFNLYGSDNEIGDVTVKIEVTKELMDKCWYKYTTNILEIKNVITGLNNLGYKVDKMVFDYVCGDLDTDYYKQFPDDIIKKLYKIFDCSYEVVPFIIKSNRLYINVDGYEIMLPDDIKNVGDDNYFTVAFDISRID